MSFNGGHSLMITREMSTKASNGIKSFESARLVDNTLSFELNQLSIVHGIRLIMAKNLEKNANEYCNEFHHILELSVDEGKPKLVTQLDNISSFRY